MEMKEVISHIEIFCPGFTNKITGISIDDILLLEHFAGRRLPDDYKTFLAHMGRENAGLTQYFAGMDLRFSTLREYYAHSSWRPPPPYILIGRDEGEMPINTFLDCSKSAEQPSVVQFVVPDDSGAIRKPPWHDVLRIASSLEELVFRCAFTNFVAYKLRFEAYGRVVQPIPSARDRIEAILPNLNLTKHPASGGMSSLYTGHVLAVQCFQSSVEEPILLYVYGDEETNIAAITDALSRHVALTVHWIEETAFIYPGLEER